jgi:Domain of unknown function (DUF3560).
MKSDFEQRKANRIEAYRRLASQNESISDNLHSKARSMGSVIPFGQPILVGHHSEKRDRNYRNKINFTYGKAIEASNKSKYYEEKAERLENNKAISSDDPEAVKKLKEELASLEKYQEQMKAANKIVKSKRAGYTDEQKIIDLKAMFPKYSETNLKSLLEPDFCGRTGFPDYRLTNNNASINRIRKRIEHLTRLNQDTTTEEEINGVRIVDSVEDNRLQLYFDGKPSEEVRNALKRNGFHWSPSQGCWQRFRSSYAKREAIVIINSIQ